MPEDENPILPEGYSLLLTMPLPGKMHFISMIIKDKTNS
jgi:hypothetical protein